MISRFAFIDTFDPAPFAAPALDDPPVRHLQILYALAAEIRPRAAIMLGGSAFAAGAFVAMLNFGFVEEIHVVSAHPTDHLRRALNLARIRERAHLHTCAIEDSPLIAADFWVVPGELLARILSYKPTLIALTTLPRVIVPEDYQARDCRLEPGLTVLVRKEDVDEDTLAFARDLLSTEQTWWQAP
jgi:hypothetical protein